MTIIEKNANARRDFVRGALAVAQTKGISKSEIKKSAFRVIQPETEELNTIPKN